MPTDVESMLLDTNVLVYAHFQESEFFAKSRTRLEAGQAEDAALCVAPQNLIEFFAIVTSLKRVFATTITSRRPGADRGDRVAARRIAVGSPGRSDIPRWLDLARASDSPKRAFDLQLAATMQGNGVRRICTFNEADFRGIPDIEIVAP